MTFVWNKAKSIAICLEKVRNFEIVSSNNMIGFSVLAWFNDRESLNMGKFDNLKEAETFVKETVKL
jgi:hypothetical protein